MFAPFALLFVVVISRVAFGMTESSNYWSWIHNFSPIAALALCGAVYLPRRVAWLMPLAMLLASDAALNLCHYHKPFFTLEILPRYLALALITALGLSLRKPESATEGASSTTGFRIVQLLAASLASSLIFYVISNTASWMGEAAYAKSFGGWFQAMTIGLPGYPPTIYFSRQTIISDLLFTALFVSCMAFQKNPAPLKTAEFAQG